MRFKTFLEAKKPKKPEELGWSGELEDLRQMQQAFSWEPNTRGKMQLFVPKKRDQQQEIQRARSNRVWSTISQLAKEDTVPSMVNHYVPKAGDNKPNQGFWTSSAFQQPDNTWSSAWLRDYLHQNAVYWIPENGYLFEVIGNPIIFDISYADRFYDWAEKYGKLDDQDKWASYDYEMRMRLNFPWDQLARHFAGVHFDGHRSDEFANGWDVESTVWFDLSHLKYRGAVKIAAPKEEND